MLVQVQHRAHHARRGRRAAAELKELCRTAGVRVLDVVDAAAAAGRSALPHRQGQARRAGHARAAGRRHHARLRSRPDAGAGAHHQRRDRAQGHRSHHADPRHLRAARAERATASCRSSWRSSSTRCRGLHEKDTMMSRLTGGIGGRGPGETKLEVNRRRARDQHPSARAADRAARQAARAAALAAHQERAAGRVDRRLHQRRQVDAAQHAHPGRRARRGQAVRHARSDLAAAALSRRSARSSSPTPSASSAICRRIWSPRSAPRSRSWPRPICCCTSSTPPIRRARRTSRAVERILDELELGEKPRLLVFNKCDKLRRGAGDRAGGGARASRSPSAPRTRARPSRCWWRWSASCGRRTSSSTSRSSPAATSYFF